MKKTITSIIISVLISLVAMVAIPLVALYYFGSNDFITILLLLMVVLNPIVSIIIGIISGGKEVKWYLPIINVAIYFIASYVIMGFDITLVIASVVYIALGLGTAYIVKAIKSKNVK